MSINPISNEARNLTVMLTYRCNAQCEHCGTFSSPLDRNDISLETALKAIDWAEECNMKQVIFSGGEPSLRWQDLLTCIKYATAKKMLTRVVSNAQWASSKEKADQRIKELKAAGLNEINYSTGDEHARFVPLDFVLFAIKAAIDAEMPTALMFELRSHSKINEELLLKRIQNLASTENLKKYFHYNRSPWMPIKPNNIAAYPDGLYANKSNIAQRVSCKSILTNYVVQANGQIAPCCGLGMRSIPELQVGNALKTDTEKNPLATAIDEAESDLFLYLLKKIGPDKLLAWAARKDPTIVWENMYAHYCQSCMRIYKDPKVKQIILENADELLADVIYGELVLQRFSEKAENILM